MFQSNASNLNVFVNNHEELTCTQNGLVYNLILPQEAIVMSLEKDNSSRYLYAVQVNSNHSLLFLPVVSSIHNISISW